MAEFQKVIKERKRMCNSFNSCVHCPLWKSQKGIGACRDWTFGNPAEAEQIIMQWSAQHPFTTNRVKFREVFGMDILDLVSPSAAIHDWIWEEYKGG